MNKYLELLPIVADRGWSLSEGYIRDLDSRCPLCALAHELSGGEVNVYEMACAALDELGAPVDADSDEIVYAADGETELRPSLMAALGMKP
jgi:hypothetical protein